MPTYNRWRKLQTVIYSILNQSYVFFELIIVDDGSKDNTELMIRSFNDRRIKYIKTDNWGGPARPRNIGLENAMGDYIAFCDDDDTWTDEKLAICVNELNNGADFVYHDFGTTSRGLKLWQSRRMVSRQLNFPVYADLLKNGNPIINSGVVFKKSIFDLTGFIDENRELIAVEDFDYWLRISKHTDNFKYINMVLGYYEIGLNSLSQNPQRALLNINCIKKKYFEGQLPDWLLYKYLRIYVNLKNYHEANEIIKMPLNNHGTKLFTLKMIWMHIRIGILKTKRGKYQ